MVNNSPNKNQRKVSLATRENPPPPTQTGYDEHLEPFADYLNARTSTKGSGRKPTINGTAQKRQPSFPYRWAIGIGAFVIIAALFIVVNPAISLTVMGLTKSNSTSSDNSSASVVLSEQQKGAIQEPILESSPQQETSIAAVLPTQASVQVEQPPLEPTLDPNLLVSRAIQPVSVQAATLKFKKIIVEEVQPRNIGLKNCDTGNSAFNAVCALKNAYGNKNNPEEFGLAMRDSGDYIKTLANQGDQVAIALREATMSEFKTSAESLISKIPELSEEELQPSAVDLGYYIGGIQALAELPEEMAYRKSLITQAGDAFAARYQVIEQVKTDAAVSTQNDPNVNANPGLGNQGQPELQNNPNPAPENNPAPEQLPENEPAPEAQAQPEPQMQGEMVKVEIIPPELTDYSKFPAVIAEPLSGFNGLSLSPEGVVRAIQQTERLLSNRMVKDPNLRKALNEGALSSNTFVVWNVYSTELPLFGKVWFFTLIEENTLKNRWAELPPTCQEFMTKMLESPDNLNISDLEQRWGANDCANYLGGDKFNQNSAMVMANLSDGSREYSLHLNEKGIVDMVGGVWWNFGRDFPIKVGNRTTFSNVAVTVLQGLLH